MEAGKLYTPNHSNKRNSCLSSSKHIKQKNCRRQSLIKRTLMSELPTFWGQLGKLLRREGAEPIVSEKNYCAVNHAVLLFGSETWVITSSMMQNIEGVHVGFLRQVTGRKAQRLGDKTWRKEGSESVLQVARQTL